MEPFEPVLFKDKFKPIHVSDSSTETTSTTESFEEKLLEEVFLPKFVQHKEPKEKYKLFYGPLNIYMFLVFFYSIYERILKAEELVR